MKILRNIDNSIKTIKLISLIVILAAFIFSSYVYFKSMNIIEEGRNKVYVLSEGNILELVRSRNLEDNIKAEIKNHISMFHEYYFNLDPEAVDIKRRVDIALNLIDDSGKLLESGRRESLYYHKMIEGGINTRIYIDSIQVSKNENRFSAKIFAKQKLERSTKLVYKEFIAICGLREIGRTENNPHGLLIENYKIIENKTLYEKSK